MRLFVAVRLERAAEAAAHAAVEALRAQSVAGTFARRENLHLTLAFLGDTPRVTPAEEAVRALRGAPFTLEFGGIGRFRRAGGDIYWLGVEENGELAALHRQLYLALTSRGFALEDRPFRPHLTLGRRVTPEQGFDPGRLSRQVGRITTRVERVGLICSERPDGILTYTPILEHALEELS